MTVLRCGLTPKVVWRWLASVECSEIRNQRDFVGPGRVRVNSVGLVVELLRHLHYGVVGIWAGKVRVAKNGWFFYGCRDNLKLTFDL